MAKNATLILKEMMGIIRPYRNYWYDKVQTNKVKDCHLLHSHLYRIMTDLDKNKQNESKKDELSVEDKLKKSLFTKKIDININHIIATESHDYFKVKEDRRRLASLYRELLSFCK